MQSFAENNSVWKNQVHIWWAELPKLRQHTELFFPLLSPEERARAERYVDPHTRAVFVCCRGLLRTLLSHYTAIDPTDARFQYSRLGKPGLLDHDANQVHFNVSHSQDAVAIALCADGPVGVDIESSKRPVSWRNLAKRYFFDAESQYLASLNEDMAEQYFLQLWVLKEAMVKQSGRGLAQLPEVRVLQPKGTFHFEDYQRVNIGGADEVCTWSMTNFSQYGAVSTPSQTLDLVQVSWLPSYRLI